MRLITYSEAGKTRVGVLDPTSQEVIDIAASTPELPLDMLALIAGGESALARVRDALRAAQRHLPLSAVQVLAPLPRPARNIICVGKNYPEHVSELKAVMSSEGSEGALPQEPIFFTKATTSVIGPGATIPASLDYTDSVDYEGELAVVIGIPGRAIAAKQALAHVFGYTIINDVTSRRLQKRHQQWFLGKSLDGFCPMGPCLLTRDEIPDVTKLTIETRINGELRQQGSTADMIFDIPRLIATLSRVMTLEAGDIIATGTPAGVGMGFKPPRFLCKGDRVTISIAPIGVLENGVD